MNFLCDVHISYKVVSYLKSVEVEAIHVNDILEKWHTKDEDICAYADANDLIILTKDADFKNSFLIRNTPKKLVKINLGNISTKLLIELLKEQLQAMNKLSSSGSFMIELEKDSVTFMKREI